MEEQLEQRKHAVVCSQIRSILYKTETSESDDRTRAQFKDQCSETSRLIRNQIWRRSQESWLWNQK